MIGTIVDTGDLLEVIWVSLVAGVGVTTAFGLAILGGTRALDFGREGRPGEAALFGALGALALAAVVAAIVFGLVGLTDK
jgi:hypothetical protein